MYTGGIERFYPTCDNRSNTVCTECGILDCENLKRKLMYFIVTPWYR
jgi:hypothetical protein